MPLGGQAVQTTIKPLLTERRSQRAHTSHRVHTLAEKQSSENKFPYIQFYLQITFPLNMSRFWPHTPYAEDQPFALHILTTHVLTRGFQCGGVIGPIIGASRYYLSKSTRASGQSLSTVILRTTGRSSIIPT